MILSRFSSRPRMITLLLILATAYIAIAAYMFFNQRRFMYFPDRNLAAPAAYGLQGFRDIPLIADDGVRIHAWIKPAGSGMPTLIYFHGNGGHLGYRADYFRAFTDAGLGMIALEYRGYGKSEGSPTEDGLYADARAALAYARGKLSLPPKQIALFGESLGTGVAVRMASEMDVGAVILEAPFTSTVDRGAEIYPWLPIGLLMHDRYESKQYIHRINAPLLILHGERDGIVPISHGRKLFALAAEPKRFVAFPNTGHNDFDADEVTKAVLDFL